VMRCHPFVKGGLDPVVKHGVKNPTSPGIVATTNEEMMSY
jgi:putative component of membrane protein insertase Oxa1/YidC/SpoIIIJ protein YidD